MTDEPRIIDHDQIIAAARIDSSREGARGVKMTLSQLWGLIHRAPSLSGAEREQLSGMLRPE